MHLTEEEILTAHLGGKIGVYLLRKLKNQKDLSIAYTPGVAQVCKAIEASPALVNNYTAKGNLVGVFTDGTAVLGLGDIGALASIPVMEGKAVLFNAFGKVNGWPVPIENARMDGNSGKTNVDKFVEYAVAIAGMYGGINLEDIAAPACFEIEETLDSVLDIPVFHDDQWGTAIITLAAIKNYCIVSKKAIQDINIVINGAGAAGIRIADMLKNSGADKISLVDSKGVIHSGRDNLNEQKIRYAINTTNRTLEDAMKGADVFIGVSVANCVTPKMISSMNNYPAIFAMANPVPEIMPEVVQELMDGKPYVMGTRRSDFPNQVNNVLGFPYIFRGALDIRTRTISMAMKMAASESLAELARLGDVPEEVKRAYEGADFDFGPNYIIPVPFDSRLLDHVSSAVARAGLKEKVSKYEKEITESEIYRLPNLQEVGDTSFFISTTIRDIAYHKGKYYVGMSIEGKDKVSYIPCSEKGIVIEHGSEDIILNPKQDPGKLLRLASMLIGQEKMLGVYKEGTLGTIASKGSWCWDEH